MSQFWHTKSIRDCLIELETSNIGLKDDEVVLRREKYGPNALPNQKKKSTFFIFFSQFQSPLIYILLISSVIIFLVGEHSDGVVVLVVLLFNAIIGSIQEGKAENTLLALNKLTKSNSTVIRNNQEMSILDEELVPGDIVLLSEGEKVPADLRILESHNLRIDEASLTGESLPVYKTSDTLFLENLNLADQNNIAFKGTSIVSGNGKGIVVATGLNTEIGKIAQKIVSIDNDIPLKKNIKNLSEAIVAFVILLCLSLFIFGVMKGEDVRTMFVTVISIAISIIPEGLPIVMTLVLATGVFRMSKRNALVKKLQAVEALGQAEVIAVDKTGTLTKNELVIRNIYVDKRFFSISGDGYEPKGEVSLDGSVVDVSNHPELLLSGKIATFCANARLFFIEEQKNWKVSGEPTEAAMLVLGEKFGFHKFEIEKESPFIEEIPFDYKLKYHSTLHNVAGDKFMTVVGALEEIIKLSTKIYKDGRIQDMTEEDRISIAMAHKKFSKSGQRVIAFAMNQSIEHPFAPEFISNIVFVGLFGMQDSLREGVRDSIREAQNAGIKIVMITGDHKITARAIAIEANIAEHHDFVLDGSELDKLTDEDLLKILEKVSVFARVTPEHKLRIVNLYKTLGKTIAMTGDGVNDAPSLVSADLGISMGKIGTEVAKEASDIVLLDDNFRSIVSAIEEGRSIFQTIKKIVLYLFSTSVGEVLTIIIALVIGLPLPIIAAQIIWLNLVTDGFLDVSLAMDPKDKNILLGKFQKPKKYIVDALMIRRTILMALPMAFGTIVLFTLYLQESINYAWTVSLTTLAVFQWFNVWNCRSEKESIFNKNMLSNRYLISATILVVLLQLFAVYNPYMQSILRTTDLALRDWYIIILTGLPIVVLEEIRKFFARRRV